MEVNLFSCNPKEELQVDKTTGCILSHRYEGATPPSRTLQGIVHEVTSIEPTNGWCARGRDA